jgi:hypothetical protein
MYTKSCKWRCDFLEIYFDEEWNVQKYLVSLDLHLPHCVCLAVTASCLIFKNFKLIWIKFGIEKSTHKAISKFNCGLYCPNITLFFLHEAQIKGIPVHKKKAAHQTNYWNIS